MWILVYPNLPHIHLYCTSNFSIPSPFFASSLSIPPLSDLSEWRLWINGGLFHSERSNRNAYIWSLTPHGAVTESQVHKWATVICKERWRWWWGHMPTIMRVCASSKVGGQFCAHAHARRKKNPSMPSVCVSLSQIVSHSVSSCVCVSAVAERK